MKKPSKLDLGFGASFIILVLIVVFNFIPIHSNIALTIYSQEIKDTPETMRIVKEIIIKCRNRTAKRDCLIDEVERFVLININYTEDNLRDEFLFRNNDINYTLTYGNDCEGKAILIADLLKQFNFKGIYLVDQSCEDNGHICVYIQDYRFVNCISECEIVFMKMII